MLDHLVKLPPINDVSSLGGATHAVPVPANPYAAIPSLHAGYAWAAYAFTKRAFRVRVE